MHLGKLRTPLQVVCLLILCGFDGRGQTGIQERPTQMSPVVTPVIYDKVLDAVFPREDPDTSRTVFMFVLRFKPSFKPESQIVIRKAVEGVDVIEYAVQNGNVYGRLNDFLAHGGSENVVKMSKLIIVRKTRVTVPYAQVKHWYNDLLTSIAASTGEFSRRVEDFDKSGDRFALLDGTTYDLFYEQESKMYFSLYDVEVDTAGSDGRFKMVQWMNTLRREVGKLSTATRGVNASKIGR
jgi:hypothetical protein